MPALRSAAAPDMCYFLLAQPTCAVEPLSCTATDAEPLAREEDGRHRSGLVAGLRLGGVGGPTR